MFKIGDLVRVCKSSSSEYRFTRAWEGTMQVAYINKFTKSVAVRTTTGIHYIYSKDLELLPVYTTELYKTLNGDSDV